MLSGRQSLYTIGAQVFIAALVIICATVLAYQGKIDAAAVTALLGGGLGLAGGVAAATSATTSAAPVTAPTRITTPEGVTVETNGAIAQPPGEGG